MLVWYGVVWCCCVVFEIVCVEYVCVYCFVELNYEVGVFDFFGVFDV